MLNRLPAIFFILLLSSCCIDQADLLDELNYCTVDTDCILIWGQCGCQIVMNKNELDTWMTESKNICCDQDIRYECLQNLYPLCEAGKCTVHEKIYKHYLVNINMPTNGTIEVHPFAIENRYVEGEVIVFRAIPDEGFMISHWTGDIEPNEGKLEVEVEIHSDLSVGAVFYPL